MNAPIRPDHPALLPVPRFRVIKSAPTRLAVTTPGTEENAALRDVARRSDCLFRCTCGEVFYRRRASEVRAQLHTTDVLAKQAHRKHVEATGCTGAIDWEHPSYAERA